MKKILASLGLILVFVLCCALVPVNAAEECAHEDFGLHQAGSRDHRR